MKKVLVFLFGLVLGAMVLVTTADFAGNFLAKRAARKVAGEQLARARKAPVRLVSERDLKGLPPVVRRYMANSGVVGKPAVRSARIIQKGSMSLGPGKSWVPFQAEQYFTADIPSFIWFGVIKVSPFMTVSAQDSYLGGEGRMYVRLMSLLKIDDAKGRDMDMAALMRFLSELMWFPSGLLGKNVRWQAVGADSARVSITDNGITVSGLCRFNKRGDLVEFIAPRLCSITGRMEEWHAGPGDGKGGAGKYMKVDGVEIPSEGFASFRLKGGEYPYIRLELARVEYDPAGTF
jgi:hypothetical protein